MSRGLSKSARLIPRLFSFGLGILVLGVVFGSAILLSSDVRVMFVIGAALLFVGGALIGRRIGWDWLAGLLLLLPLWGAFAFLALRQLPFLWPNLVLWAVATILGLLLLNDARRSRIALIGGAVALVICSVWYCASYIPDQMQRALNRFGNDAAPTFTLSRLSAGSVPQSATPGKILVIDFFATWCRPCIAELPEIKAIREELHDRKDIEFVVAGTNAGGDTPERLLEFAKRHPIGLPLAFDAAGKAHAGFGLSGFPGLVVIDRTGRVRLKREGYNSSEVSFRRDMVQFLKTL